MMGGLPSEMPCTEIFGVRVLRCSRLLERIGALQRDWGREDLNCCAANETYNKVGRRETA